MSTKLTEISSNKVFGGFQKVFSHNSSVLGCVMKFGVYLPPAATEIGNATSKFPVVYWLSGLTCSEMNFIEKSGFQRYAAEFGLIIVNPDTSPRDVKVDGDSDSWDLGVGAGFYINATNDPWKKNYQMYDYVTKELVQLIQENFNVTNQKSIMGHSMGGHGALIMALKNPNLFKSISAFAPICNPIKSAWGKKAFKNYLGDDNVEKWSEWDATELVQHYNGPPIELFVDQGSDDQFLAANQLNPQNLIEKTANLPKVSVLYKLRAGYNHSYYYIASFIGEHLKYHAEKLKKTNWWNNFSIL